VDEVSRAGPPDRRRDITVHADFEGTTEEALAAAIVRAD